MGSRGRSIRLHIYFLVAIPLVTMVRLAAYLVTTSVDNPVSLDRAPNLVNATAIPAANLGADLGLVSYETAVLVRRSGEHIKVNARAAALSGSG